MNPIRVLSFLKTAKLLASILRSSGCPLPLTGSDVEPVWVVRSELLLRSSLNRVDPCWDFELTRPLEVGRVCGDERFGAGSMVSTTFCSCSPVTSNPPSSHQVLPILVLRRRSMIRLVLSVTGPFLQCVPKCSRSPDPFSPPVQWSPRCGGRACPLT